MSTRGREHWLLLSAMTVAALAAAAVAGAEVNLAGFQRVGQVEVPLTGREVALPLVRGARPGDLRIVLDGVFSCSYNGRSYDAFYTTSDTGALDRRHDYVRWSPDDMKLAEYDTSAHRYVLKLANDRGELPQAVTARVNVDRFVTDLIITPSQVTDSLSGNLRLGVWRSSRSGAAAWLTLGLVLVAAALVAVLLRRRARPAAEMADVAQLLSRIERKYGSAMSVIEGQRPDAFELSSQLERLRDGAQELAEHIAAFRGAAGTVDQQQLEGEIAQVEQQLEQTQRDDLRQEIEATLAAKRKLRDLLADTEANEARYLLRLSKIESTMDATTVWVAGQEARLADEVGEDRAIAELQQELKSLDEAIEELKILD